ncbi:hypothetical protein [Patulibacter minatonensis]|uniref:hypothetical protein n=1 Tax=Patulibacter minatonensis TaxID=298163 RepID=UPI00047E037B|nr:hypothetical protein [Patulibacter minatonensis]
MDDAHRVTAPESTELLRAIATAPPHGVRVVVAARITADGWPDRLGAPTVDADALAFTAEESTAVLESAWGPGTDHRRLAQAHRTTGGWPAAVGLVTDAVAGAPGWRTFSESLDAAAVAIARRVASDVLAGTDEDLRRFLLRTATLRRPDEDACAAVTAEPGAGELLRRARRSGVLTTGAGGAPVHRGPFRVALRRLLEELEPALVPTLHRRASAWSAACGDLGTAAEHATAAGDVLRAVAIADAHVAHRGALPGPGAADAPRGVAPPASASAWPADVAAARRQLDDHPEADATVRGAASAALALALWRTGDDEAVRAHLEPRIGATVDPATRCWSLALLALAVAPRDPQRAEALARHARRISRRPGATWLEPVLAHQALADALRARGDLGAAHVALGEAAVRTGAVPGSGHHGLTLLLRAELAIAAGDPAAARRVLRDGDPVGVPAGRVAATRAAAA